MAAHADDLRFYYLEHLGASEIKQATNADTSFAKFTLASGRYRVTFRAVAGGATVVWAEQKKAGAPEGALDAVPATPHDLSTRTDQFLFTTMVRTRPVTRTEETDVAALDTLYFRTDAGNVDIVVTKISRD